MLLLAFFALPLALALLTVPAAVWLVTRYHVAQAEAPMVDDSTDGVWMALLGEEIAIAERPRRLARRCMQRRYQGHASPRRYSHARRVGVEVWRPKALPLSTWMHNDPWLIASGA